MENISAIKANRTSSLTEVEERGLTYDFSLADGHAYHDLDIHQSRVVSNLPELWMHSKRVKHAQLEKEFVRNFYILADQPVNAETSFFRLCTSASQSIDMIANWLKRHDYTVGLIEPTFDNLAQILHRWNLKTQPLDEAMFHSEEWQTSSTMLASKAIFIVCPNNPTGTTLPYTFFEQLVEWALTHDKVLIFDFCFRFFLPFERDIFDLLRKSGVTFLAVEDTGKTWPTLDMKVSIMTYSDDVSTEIEDIYSEILLCVSPFSVVVLTEFIKTTAQLGLKDTLWHRVEGHRRMLRECLPESIMDVHNLPFDCKMPVEWVRIKEKKMSDLDVVDALSRHGVVCLPGRYFYWSMNGKGQNHVRFSLLKPNSVIRGACEVLTKLSHLRGENITDAFS